MNFTTYLFVLILIHTVINFLMKHTENHPIHRKMEKLLNCTNKGILVNLAFFIKEICDAFR